MEQQALIPMPETALAPAQDQFLSIIAAAVSNPQIDTAKMEALLAMKERVDAKEAEKEFHGAMAAMSAEMPRVKKNGSIDLGKGKPVPFAKWEDCDAVLRPILKRHGFSLSFVTRVEGGQLLMACVVSHVGGHSERSECAVQADSGPGRNATQAIGSGRSYAKRYLALDMLNVVTEGADDDGKAAGRITEQQAGSIHDMIAELELSDARRKALLKTFGVGSVEEVQHYSFEPLMALLRQELAMKRAGVKR